MPETRPAGLSLVADRLSFDTQVVFVERLTQSAQRFATVLGAAAGAGLATARDETSRLSVTLPTRERVATLSSLKFSPSAAAALIEWLKKLGFSSPKDAVRAYVRVPMLSRVILRTVPEVIRSGDQTMFLTVMVGESVFFSFGVRVQVASPPDFAYTQSGSDASLCSLADVLLHQPGEWGLRAQYRTMGRRALTASATRLMRCARALPCWPPSASPHSPPTPSTAQTRATRSKYHAGKASPAPRVGLSVRLLDRRASRSIFRPSSALRNKNNLVIAQATSRSTTTTTCAPPHVIYYQTSTSCWRVQRAARIPWLYAPVLTGSSARRFPRASSIR